MVAGEGRIRRSRSSSIAGESLNNPGPNVNAYEEDLRRFVTSNNESAVYGDSRWPEANPASWHLNEAQINTFSFNHI